MKLNLFASCAIGLETLLAREIAGCGGEPKVVAGGVELVADDALTIRLLLELGVASHLLARVGTFHAHDLDQLESHIARMPWSGWLRPNTPLRIRATAARSRNYHTGAIAERIERGIRTRLGDSSPEPAEDDTSPEHTAIPLLARFVDNRCTLSIDLGGEPLHRRGYRLEPHRAPLREDIARALVLASGWDQRSTLIDPMCGSGTIVIEAARLVSDYAPGLERHFAYEQLALADGSALSEARQRARTRCRALEVRIVARDRDPKALDVAQRNATRAGVATIHFERGALSQVDATNSMGASIVTNPPWGERIAEGPDLRALYQTLGRVRSSLGAGSRLALMTPDRNLAYSTGIKLKSAFQTDLGGIKTYAMAESWETDQEWSR